MDCHCGGVPLTLQRKIVVAFVGVECQRLTFQMHHAAGNLLSKQPTKFHPFKGVFHC